MSNITPVIAVIPNYNMARQLDELLPQTLNEQNYDAVYVLDDASTDASLEVAHHYLPDGQIIAGKENVGSGTNRNRIVQAELGRGSIYHFIDADMQLETKDTVPIARELMGDDTTAFVGGLVSNHDGTQFEFNFGPRQCLRNDITVPLHLGLTALGKENFPRERALRDRFSKILNDWPNPTQPAVARNTFWVSEANMLVDSAVFEQVGGYDPRLRDHEIQDLAIRLHKLGLVARFDPSIEATHKDAGTRKGNERSFAQLRAEYYIARKHGFRNWLKQPSA